jgi:ribosomal protein L44E
VAKKGFVARLASRLSRETKKEVRRSVTGSSRTLQAQVRRKARKEVTGSSNRVTTQAANKAGMNWLVRLFRGGK